MRLGKEYSQIFWDYPCGGKEKAKVKAIEWRNIILEKLPIPPSIQSFNSRNNTGVVGIRHDKNQNAYQVFIPKIGKGKPSLKFFSINAYGRKNAFLFALETRIDAVQKITNYRLTRKNPQWSAKARAIKLRKHEEIIPSQISLPFPSDS